MFKLKTYTIVLLLLSFLSAGIAKSTLSKDIQLDMLTAQLEESLDIEDNQKTIEIVRKMRALGISDIRLDFLEGKGQFGLEEYSAAKPLLINYLEEAGSEGDFHKEALLMLADLDGLEKDKLERLAKLEKSRIEQLARSEKNRIKRIYIEARDTIYNGKNVSQHIKQLEDISTEYLPAKMLLAKYYFEGVYSGNWAKGRVAYAGDASKARSCFESLLKQDQIDGELEYKYKLAQLYRYGLGGGKDVRAACELFESILLNSPEENQWRVSVRLALYSIYAYGEGNIERDLDKAKSYACHIVLHAIGSIPDKALAA